MQINLDGNRENFKAVAYPPPELLTTIHGPAGPETVLLSSDELKSLGWPVVIDGAWSAHVVVPVASGVAS